MAAPAAPAAPAPPDAPASPRDAYAEARARFRWATARAALEGLPDGGLNIAHEAVDRHVAAGRGGAVALRWLGRRGERRDVTFAELAAASDRCAAVLRGLGVLRGERVFLLCDRTPDLFVAALGAWKHGAVVAPLFTAFGPEPLRLRLALGDARALVTSAALYARKVAPIRAALPQLAHVLLTAPVPAALPPGTIDLADAMLAAPASHGVAPTREDDPALLHFTSGTTGTPKGALHVHGAVVAHHATARLALDLQPGDTFWCTADPGWVTGMSYGIVAPLTCGVTSIVDEGDFDAARWYEVLERERVTVWYTAPTAIRMLMRAGPELARRHDLSHLRFVASVGEPLNPEAVRWGEAVLGRPIHDNWWQTETGGIMIANVRGQPIRPGSMGRPLPGIDAAVVRREGDRVTVLPVDAVGELALRPGWPSMFRGYLGDEARYRQCFVGGWYCTGDLVRFDADGYAWFVGRADDVIKSSGHLIGPFEVESALLEHPAVAEAAVVGLPDPLAGEVVHAWVACKPGHAPGDALRDTLLGFARTRLGAALAPKAITFVDALPRTRSGKLMRRLLRARALGLPEGDLSTLEGPAT